MSRSLMMGDALPQGNPPGLIITHTDTKAAFGANVHSLTGVAAGALLVVTTGNQFSNQQCTVSSSPSLTFTRVVDNNTPNAEIFTATFVAGGAITVTVNWGSSVQSSVCYALTGQDTNVGNGTAASLQAVADLNVTTTRTNSLIFCVTTNWNAPDAGPGGNNTVYRGTPTQSSYFRDVTASTFWHYFYPAVNIQSYNVGFTSPSDVDSGCGSAVWEVRSLTGTGAPPDTTDPVMGATLTSPTKTNTTVDLSWSAATDNIAVTGYQVYVDGALRTTVTSTNYQVTGLIASTAYAFTVVARDAAGNGEIGSTAQSNVLNVTTNPNPPNQPPTPPTNLQAPSKTQTTINITWTAATDDVAVAQYGIYLNGSVFDTIAAPSTAYQYTGLTADTTYALRVRSIDGGGLFADSSTINVATDPIAVPDTTPPVWPGGALSSTGQGSNTIDLEWNPGATDNIGVVRYEVFRVGVPSPLATFTGTPPTTLTYTASGLTPNTSYQFFVRAFDAAGNNAQSNTVTVSTTQPAACGNTLTFTALTGDFRRYWGGGEFWGTNENFVPLFDGSGQQFQEAQRYRRFTWRDLEGDTQGSYRFQDKLLPFFQTGISQKQMVSFGLITVYPCPSGSFHDFSTFPGGVQSPYPLYLHNLMQAESTTKDWISTACNSHWVPNYNSPSYLARLDALYLALANYLDNTFVSGVRLADAVGYVDIRGVGSWGEWHHGSTAAGNDAQNMINDGTFPSNATFTQIIDIHKNRFPNYQLVAMFATFDKNHANGAGFDNTRVPASIGQYVMDNGNAYGDIGIRRDQWGDPMEYYTLIQNNSPITGPPTRYLTAPVNGEPPGYAVVGGPCGCGMGHFPQQSQTQHASIVGNSNYGGSRDENTMRTAFQNMGHKLRPQEGCYGLTATTLTIRLDWRNFGLTPMYRKNWQVTFEIRNSAGTTLMSSHLSTYDPYLHTAEDGVQSVTDAFARPALANGTYQLRLIVKDPNNYLEPLQLAMTGRQTDGSYILTSSLIFS